jgi:Lon protease-like protein|tara:strand:- start:8 stop:634 length:627 start_codon:yes stop_codon:yes gene_type:complete
MIQLPKKIPIFPLRGVIFFPETNLPLNIFEERYLKMTNDILKNDKFLGMVQSKEINGEIYQVGCLGRIEDHSKTPDGRILINLRGVTRFKIVKETENKEPYREFLVNYDIFKEDLNLKKIKIENEDLKGAIEKSKNLFKKQGIEINWNEFSKLSDYKQVYTLAMISPISVEEKQKLLEIADLYEMTNVLNDITNFNLYEITDQNKILQ